MDEPEFEARLAARLHARFDRLEPTPALASRVAGSLRDTASPRWPARSMAALLAVVALTVAVVVAFAWLPGGLGGSGTTPSPSPSPSPSGGVTTVTVFLDPTHSMVVTISDESGLLTAARAATASELTRPLGPSWDTITVLNPSGRPSLEVRLLWLGTRCDQSARLVIGDLGRAMWLYEGPRPVCDLVGVTHGLVLTFSRPIDASSILAKLSGPPTSPDNASPSPVIPTQPPAEVTSTWVRATLPIPGGTGQLGLPGGGGIASLPSGGFIAFAPQAPDRSIVLTSPDGTRWTQTGTVSGSDAVGIAGPVAFDGRLYVALGSEGGGGYYGQQENGAAWVSTDLRHWTKAPDQVAFGGVADWSGIAGGPKGFVAVGYERGGRTVWTSPDGLHWTLLIDDAVFPDEATDLTAIARNAGGLLIVGSVGQEAASWSSSDGQHWTLHSPLSGGAGVVLEGLAAGPAGWVSTGVGGGQSIEVAPGDYRQPVAGWRSPDGRTWTIGPSSPALFGASPIVVSVPGGYVAAGMAGSTAGLWTSTDGLAWTPVAGVDLGGVESVSLVSDGRHAILMANGPKGPVLWVTSAVR